MLHQLAFSLSIAAIFVTANPCFAQESPPAAQTYVAFKAKGPVPLAVTYRGERDSKFMTELGIVNRSNVVGANAAKLAVGVALIVLTGSATMEGTSKEHLYGDRISDVRDRRKLASPFLDDLPAALDQKIVELVAESPELAAAPFGKAMTITPSGFSLQYHELMADKEKEDQYVLYMAADFSKILEGEESSLFHKARRTDRACTYVSKPQTLSAWKANDYEAVTVEQKLATKACVDAVTPFLPQFLGFNAKLKARDAKTNCQNIHKTCVAAADLTPEPLEPRKLCKADYNQCIATDVRPIIDSTPIGACKATYAACKTTAVVKARAVDPEGKADKTEINACVSVYKTCISAAR